MGKAGVAQLVEHDLAKVGVASSSLVSRSKSLSRYVLMVYGILKSVAEPTLFSFWYKQRISSSEQ